MTGTECGERVGRDRLRYVFNEKVRSEECNWTPWACTSCETVYSGPNICCEEEKYQHLNKRFTDILDWLNTVEQDEAATSSMQTKYLLDDCTPPPVKEIAEIVNILLSPHGVQYSAFLNNSWVVTSRSKCNCVPPVLNDLEGGAKIGTLLDLKGHEEAPKAPETVSINAPYLEFLETSSYESRTESMETSDGGDDEQTKLTIKTIGKFTSKYEPTTSLIPGGFSKSKQLTEARLTGAGGTPQVLREILGLHLVRPYYPVNKAKEAACCALLLRLARKGELTETRKRELHYQLSNVTPEVLLARLNYLREDAASHPLAEFAESCPHEHNFIAREDLEKGGGNL